MIAIVHYVVVIPKGKEYNQLAFHCITGVVARFGILLRSLPQNKLRDPELQGRQVPRILGHHLEVQPCQPKYSPVSLIFLGEKKF